MRWINDIIVHCTATPAGREVTIKELDSWHRDKGFNGIGYHFVVHLDGSIEQGRPVTAIGAHCLRHNQFSIGVAYVGGVNAKGENDDTRTPAQKKSLINLLTRLHEKYGAPIHGHCDYAAKDCPCFNAAAEYKFIYNPD